MAELEMNADDHKLMNVVQIFSDTLFCNVGFGKSNNKVSSSTVIVDSSSEVALQKVLAVVPEHFYL